MPVLAILITNLLAILIILDASPVYALNESITQPWPMFHGQARHTGLAISTGPQFGKLKWKFKAGSGRSGQWQAPPPNSSAIDSHGIIYVASAEKVYALRPDGTVKWARTAKQAQGPALSANGKILYFAANHQVMAVAAEFGKRRWKFSVSDRTLFGPTIGPDGTIYQGSWDGYLYALNPTGKLRWQYQTAGAVSYPVTIDSNGIILLGGGDAHAGPDSNVYAFRSDGTLLWKYDTNSLRVGSSAVGPDGFIYVPAAPNLIVLNSAGQLQWKLGSTNNDEVAGIISPAIAADGTIYIGSSKGLVQAINPITHQIIWTYQTGAEQRSGTFYGLPSFPVVDQAGNLYIGSVDGNLYAFNSSGKLLWTYQTGGKIAEAAPALGADGTLYFSSDDGYVYAIQD